MTELLAEELLEGMYGEWLDNMACIYETQHYGHSRAAFYAGAAAMKSYLEGQGIAESTGTSQKRQGD